MMDLESVRGLGKSKLGKKSLEDHLMWKGLSLWETIGNNFYEWVLRISREDETNKIEGTLLQLSKRYLKRIVYFIRRLRCKQSTSKGAIVFLPFTKTQVQLMEPVFRESLKMKEQAYFLRRDNLLGDLKKMYENNGLPYDNIECFWTSSTNRELRSFERRLKYIWKEIVKDSSFQREIRFSELRPILDYYFNTRKKIMEVFVFALLMDNFVKKKRPKAVVLPEDTSEVGATSAKVCKMNSVPVVMLQHGIMSRPFIYKDGGDSDIYLVWSQRSKRTFRTFGIPEKKIRVVGCPLYDFVEKERDDKFYSDFGLDPERKTLIFASQRLKGRKQALEIVSGSLRQLQDVQLVDKLHPVESYSKDLNEHLSYFKNEKRAAVVRNEDKKMTELWPYCNILIGMDSTVMLEAMAMGKPVIVLNPHKKKLFIPYTKYGAAIEVSNKKELVDAVTEILKNKRLQTRMRAGRKKLVRDYFYKIDGKASERVIKTIKGL